MNKPGFIARLELPSAHLQCFWVETETVSQNTVEPRFTNTPKYLSSYEGLTNLSTCTDAQPKRRLNSKRSLYRWWPLISQWMYSV